MNYCCQMKLIFWWKISIKQISIYYVYNTKDRVSLYLQYLDWMPKYMNREQSFKLWCGQISVIFPPERFEAISILSLIGNISQDVDLLGILLIPEMCWCDVAFTTCRQWSLLKWCSVPERDELPLCLLEELLQQCSRTI